MTSPTPSLACRPADADDFVGRMAITALGHTAPHMRPLGTAVVAMLLAEKLALIAAGTDPQTTARLLRLYADMVEGARTLDMLAAATDCAERLQAAERARLRATHASGGRA